MSVLECCISVQSEYSAQILDLEINLHSVSVLVAQSELTVRNRVRVYIPILLVALIHSSFCFKHFEKLK
jgi:hypothetical protein